jgi:hypothetical protein
MDSLYNEDSVRNGTNPLPHGMVLEEIEKVKGKKIKVL